MNKRSSVKYVRSDKKGIVAENVKLIIYESVFLDCMSIIIVQYKGVGMREPRRWTTRIHTERK
jgi:hypothetical protein